MRAPVVSIRFNQCYLAIRNAMGLFQLFLFTALALSLFSCVSNKKLVYMQELSQESKVATSGEIVPYDVDEYRLQVSDVVDVTMKTTSTELNEILKIENESQLRNVGGLNSGDAFFLNGYSIDDSGVVNLPLIGEIKLVGKTVNEAKAAIAEKLKQYIKEDNFYVRVRLGGIRYSALGEFNRPGKFTILENRVTIFDAIANAGDMTVVAKRSRVVLIRQYPEGSRRHVVNLLDRKILESEFYFIRPNDIIYAEPMKVKQLGTGITAAQTFQLVLSVLTVVLLFTNVTN